RPDLAAMRGHDLLAARETEALSGDRIGGPADAIEAVEDASQMIGRDAHPVVDHADLADALLDRDRHEDRLARWRVRDRIGDQVVEKLREPRLPDRDAHRLGRGTEVDPGPTNTRARDGLPRLGRRGHRPP